MLILLGLYFIVPESTRWLIAQGRNEEAKVAITRRASFNRYVAHYNRGIAFEMELVKRMLDRQISLILQYVKKCLYFEEIEKRALRKLKHTK